MKRQSFQFYPADWSGNAKLRRCSESARGAWVDLMCVFHDSDEYGLLRWPLADLARSAGVSLKSVQELHRKDVLKGSDGPIKDFIFTPRHAGRDGESVVLIKACNGPCWFSSRMVTDEWVRLQRGTNARFESSPKPSPKLPIGSTFGDGPTSSSSSSSSSSIRKEEKKDSPALEKVRSELSRMFLRKGRPWTYEEEFALSEVCQSPTVLDDLRRIVGLRDRMSLEDRHFFPRSAVAVLRKWSTLLDTDAIYQTPKSSDERKAIEAALKRWS